MNRKSLLHSQRKLATKERCSTTSVIVEDYINTAAQEKDEQNHKVTVLLIIVSFFRKHPSASGQENVTQKIN